MKIRQVVNIKYALILLATILFVWIISKYILRQEEVIIHPNLIRIEQISIEENKLKVLGKIIPNSFYGEYSGYTYIIENKKLYLSFHSQREILNIEQPIKFEVIDDALIDIKEIYLRGNVNIGDIPVFTRF